MTARVLFLGNSHIAALREAWKADPDRWPDMAAQFVGAHKDLLLQTRIEGSRFLPDSDEAAAAFQRLGGVSEVNLAEYDHIVITGCMVALPQAVNTYRDARWPGLPSVGRVRNLGAMKLALISRAAAIATVEATILRRLGPQLANRLREATPAPIWITSQPRVSARIRTAKTAGTRHLKAALANGDAAGLSEVFETAASRAAASVGARFLPQPDATIEASVLTALPYVLGAKRLTVNGNLSQPPEDVMHANAEYGARVLDQITAAIAS